MAKYAGARAGAEREVRAERGAREVAEWEWSGKRAESGAYSPLQANN